MINYKEHGTIKPDSRQLFDLARKGMYVYIRSRSSDETIKNNLIWRTFVQLNRQGIMAFEIDAKNIAMLDHSKFYNQLIIEIGISTFAFPQEKEASDWFKENKHLSPEQKLTTYLEDVLLKQTQRPVVIIITNTQAIHLQPYSDKFFSLIRSYYNSRSTDFKWKNITFILQGTVPAWQLIKSTNLSKYNIGQFLTLGTTAANKPQYNKLVKILYSCNNKFYLKPYMWFNHESSTYLRVWWLWFQIDIIDSKYI